MGIGQTGAMATAWISMGSNVGDRGANLLEAARRLAAVPGVSGLARGPFRATEAVVLPGAPPQRGFLNAAARVEATLDPPQLLRAMLGVERAMGRPPAERRAAWAPRAVDLDLLFHGRSAGAWADPPLQLPHRSWSTRAFVLLPVLDVEPGFVSPEQTPRAALGLLRGLCRSGVPDKNPEVPERGGPA